MLTRCLMIFASLFCLIQTHAALAQTNTPTQNQQTILVIGDSLAAEYGIERGTGWVEQINQKLVDASAGYRVKNASISGDTTSGGLTRLPDALEKHQPSIVIIELGSNDALRGLSLDMTRENLTKMIQLARQADAQVLLVGMRIPPNYGPTYTTAFYNLFQDLAREQKTSLVPFLLDDIATDRNYFQDDGIHPNESAQPVLAEHVWNHLTPMLDKNQASSASSPS
ncbi:MAG TPA: arylesterase [Pusillimonas sp.]|nr:arylesterase [Pusillimonas sp.]MBC43501.1 arylesterase [Pusillimonas sp.]HBT32561.1 arylesterase [Pusillimonas sp.]HCN72417.1 arylesterase [Pusillimonas sp.]HCP76235.1 arylesterase [Pusillimonas sp.]|tara:strand:- start:35812 stop:36486 length:675 start_codon:yes stop_codon:yes gene_type:complete